MAGVAGMAGMAGGSMDGGADAGDAAPDGPACETLPEVCNGLDDNCNGTIDEGDPGGGGTCTVPNAQGICADGIERCANGVLVCESVESPKPEDCNGLDDNCNGAVDEGNPDGNEACNTTQPGICADGVTKCESGAIVCEQLSQSQPEVCNGLDDDCDGTPDDGFAGAGDPCQVTGQIPNTPCATGLTNCLTGQSNCTQTVFPQPEVCDGVDNDCDGTIDNPSAVSGSSCDTGNMGVCAAGVTTCVAGNPGCQGAIQPGSQFESCNALDDDCNGTIDDVVNVNLECATKNSGASHVSSWACTVGFCQVTSCGNPYLDCDFSPANGCEINGNTDVFNCGGCNNACDDTNGEPSCSGGNCGIQCDVDWGNCDNDITNGCETPLDTDTNCGFCGNSCTNMAGTNTCQGGVCVPVCDPGAGNCDGNPNNGCETDLNTSTTHCGACMNTCVNPNGTTQCSGGSCMPSCTGAYRDCSNPVDGCETNTANDPASCGGCGITCINPNGTTQCVGSTCQPSCSGAALNCDGNPVNGCETDGATSEAHCGACMNACTNAHGTTSCLGGTCSPQCSGDYRSCDGDPDNGCETNTATDVNNCGGCGAVCTNPNGTTSCQAKTCVPSCDSDHLSCDGDPTDGCETNIKNDVNNCGACNNQCTNAHGSTSCSNGTCSPTCTGDWRDCDGDPDNGCETNISNDVDHCGMCDNECTNPGGSVACNNKTCQPGCTQTTGDCDGNPGNGCETSTTTVANCGGCGILCTNAHGSTACVGQVCSPTCSGSWRSCDGDPNDGCETDTATAINNCGGCGIQCTNAHGSTSCSGGTCAPVCDQFFADCDGDPTNGCETDTRTSDTNCGGCGTVCQDNFASNSCVSGTCVPVCDSGRKSCDGNPNNGCETNIASDESNCGNCNVQCVNNASTSSNNCNGGSCTPVCNSGYGNCDGFGPNACETNTTNDKDHCGTCTTDCDTPLPAQATSAVCQSSTCEVATCQSNYFDRNGNHGDGCECLSDGFPNACNAATELGPVPISSTNVVTAVSANLADGNDDWFRITFNHTPNSCSFSPRLVLKNQGNPIRMRVHKSCSGASGSGSIPCSDAGNSAPANGITSWEYTNSANCGDKQSIDPNPEDGSTYLQENTQIPTPTTLYVRIYPIASGASCMSYELEYNN